jgi:hypothetical protein
VAGLTIVNVFAFLALSFPDHFAFGIMALGAPHSFLKENERENEL